MPLAIRTSIVLMCCSLVLSLTSCTANPGFRGEWVDLLSTDLLPKWHAAVGYEERRAWTMAEGEYYGYGSIVCYQEPYTDFELQAEFLFDGRGEGGIQIRGNQTAIRSWELGNELDIDVVGDDSGRGHIHFPVNPKPYGGDAQFVLGRWQQIHVEATGPRVTVRLHGTEVLTFEDGGFLTGQICLQGEKDGVRYRNLRVKRL